MHEASQAHVTPLAVPASSHNPGHFGPQKFNFSSGVYLSTRALVIVQSRSKPTNAATVMFIKTVLSKLIAIF